MRIVWRSKSIRPRNRVSNVGKARIHDNERVTRIQNEKRFKTGVESKKEADAGLKEQKELIRLECRTEIEASMGDQK